MIRLEGVSKLYGESSAVSRLSLEVSAGEVCVLVGPSGCGKTTTLRMINRLVEPTEGKIYVDGRDIRSVRPEELRRHIGYAIQSVGLFPHLTVAVNIAVVPRLLGWDAARTSERVGQLLSLVGLPPEYAEKYPRQLSGGEAQRVGVARALAADPPVLLMDEPFGAVDPLTRERLQGEFARIQKELRKTVVFVTHDVDEAIRLADRIAVLRDGQLQQHASPEEILDSPANKFVHDFMGADRALKRLGRVRVSDFMRTGVPAVVLEEMGAAGGCVDAPEGQRYVYATDSRGALRGWFDCAGADAGEGLTEVEWRGGSVRFDATLREALSMMLGLGVRAVPVTDSSGVLLGEVALRDIEDAMTNGGAR